jgi:hypothetical protein
MRSKSLVLATILLVASAYAKEPKAYQSAKVLQMDSAQCGVDGKGAKTPSCQDYLLQAEQVIYRIRPRSLKHAVLLPVGEWAQFRLENNKMLLRVPSSDSPASDRQDSDSREREYIVVSMTPRGDSTADAHPVRLNHLQ